MTHVLSGVSISGHLEEGREGGRERRSGGRIGLEGGEWGGWVPVQVCHSSFRWCLHPLCPISSSDAAHEPNNNNTLITVNMYKMCSPVGRDH